MKLLWIIGLVSLQCLFSVSSSLADELVTDRPDATESSSVMRPGYIQAEVGMLVTDIGLAEITEYSQTLIRIGAIDRVELRLGWTGYILTDQPAGGEGVGDGEGGAKIYLWEGNGAVPEVALLAGLTLPWGEPEVSSNEWDPSFRFALSHSLSSRASLGYNLGVEWSTLDISTASFFVYTSALGFGLTELLSVFVEVYGDIGISETGEAHMFDGGFTCLLSDNLQFDLLAGAGLSGDTDDWFVGGGISYRYPD